MVLATLGAAAGSMAMNYWSQKNAAKQNLSAQKQLSTMNFNQQKYFAENAHQMEMADLKKAGLNPALTATGGNGASASGGGIPGTQGIQPIDVLNGMKTLIDARNQTSATQSQNELNKAQALNIIANTDNIPYQNKIAMINAKASQITAEAATTNATVNKNLGEIEVIRKKGTKEYPLGRAAEIGEKELKKRRIKKAYDKNLKLLRSDLYLHKLPNKY